MEARMHCESCGPKDMTSNKLGAGCVDAVAGNSVVTEAGNEPTILLVEDEDFVREATAEILHFNGYRVLKARSPVEAIELFCKHRQEIRLLLTDLVLPGQSGQSLANYLQHLQPGFKTLFMSGYPERVLNRAPDREADGNCVAKPFSLECLLAKIRQVLFQEDAVHCD
jgi:two-component system, cell cycle sensor histidine kinase and response regulator CckA